MRNIRNNLTPISIFWVILGSAAFLYGAYIGYKWRMYFYSFGLLATGFGGIVCGMTNGFTSHTPIGRVVSKFGIIGLLIGISMIIYYFYKFI